MKEKFITFIQNESENNIDLSIVDKHLIGEIKGSTSTFFHVIFIEKWSTVYFLDIVCLRVSLCSNEQRVSVCEFHPYSLFKKNVIAKYQQYDQSTCSFVFYPLPRGYASFNNIQTLYFYYQLFYTLYSGRIHACDYMFTSLFFVCSCNYTIHSYI